MTHYMDALASQRRSHSSNSCSQGMRKIAHAMTACSLYAKVCQARLGDRPILQGSYSPFEKTIFEVEDQSMPPREITDQSASPLIPNSFLQFA